MALIPNIVDTGAGQDIQEMYNSLNLLIDKFNLLSGGTAGQYPAKIDGDDFNFEFVDTPVLKTKIINIGDWNMQSTASKGIGTLASFGLDFRKIRFTKMVIRSDDDLSYTTDEPDRVITVGGVDLFAASVTCNYNATAMFVSRSGGSTYNSVAYSNGSSFNRGFITVGYID